MTRANRHKRKGLIYYSPSSRPVGARGAGLIGPGGRDGRRGLLELGLADIARQVYNVRSHDARGAQDPRAPRRLQRPARSEGPTPTD